MTNRLILSLLALVCSSEINAQTSDRQFIREDGWRLIVGGSYSSVVLKSDKKLDSRFGPAIGIAWANYLGSVEFFYNSLGFSEKGIETKMSYLTAQTAVGPLTGKRGLLGPEFGFGLQYMISADSSGTDVTTKYHNFDILFILGVGGNFSDAYSYSVRLVDGFLDVYKAKNIKGTPIYLQVSVSYLLGKRRKKL